MSLTQQIQQFEQDVTSQAAQLAADLAREGRHDDAADVAMRAKHMRSTLQRIAQPAESCTATSSDSTASRTPSTLDAS